MDNLTYTSINTSVILTRKAYDKLLDDIRTKGKGYVENRFGKKDEVIILNEKLVEKETSKEIACFDNFSEKDLEKQSNLVKLMKKYGDPYRYAGYLVFTVDGDLCVYDPTNDTYYEPIKK